MKVKASTGLRKPVTRVHPKPLKKLLFLWSPLADYSVACIRSLATREDLSITLIFQPAEENAPYSGFDLSFCNESIPYSKDQAEMIFTDCVALDPDMIFMTSWNYPLYMRIARSCRKKGTYVIAAFDGQWAGTIRQQMGIMASPFFLKPAIDNFFVPGDRQANFARKLGFKNPLQGYYCANTGKFLTLDKEKTYRRKNFIFIGRLVPEKGVINLIKAYKRYREFVQDPWGLIICGKGELDQCCLEQDGVQLAGFIQPSSLPALMVSVKCLVLPSNFEPWGLVVHEAALCGLAIIASSACGAATQFVREGLNGYTVNPDEVSLSNAMIKIAGKDETHFEELSAASKTLGNLWTTDKWAAYVYDNILDNLRTIKG